MPIYYNCHTHSFNNSHVPDCFLSVRGIGRFAAKTAASLINIPFIGKGLVKVLAVSPATKKYSDFLSVGIMKTQDLVFKEVKDRYPIGTRIVVLPLNFQFMGAGKLRIPYVQQLAQLIDLKTMYADVCLPFVFIDPRMGTAEQNRDFVKKYIDKGFSGIKLYPSLGYYPYDERMDLVYAYAAENQVPILTHCSRGGIHYVNQGKTIPADFLNPSNLNPSWQAPKIVSNTDMSEFKNNFIRPDAYEGVLKKYKNLKLCFAHFGVDNDHPFPDGKLKGADDWYHEVIRFINEYDNVYTDVSYSLTQDKFVKGFYNDYNQNILPDKVKDRIMYGTDFFMIEQETNNNDNKLFNDFKNKFGQAAFDKMASDNVAAFLQMNPLQPAKN